MVASDAPFLIIGIVILDGRYRFHTYQAFSADEGGDSSCTVSKLRQVISHQCLPVVMWRILAIMQTLVA
jgi:hypothetical protein